MFAVIKTGGKQYRVAANDTLTVERLVGEPGDIITIGSVLMLAGDTQSSFGKPGAPGVAGASVAVEIVEHTRGAKVIAFKKRRRKNSRRKRGHRQDLTVIRVTEILTDGAKPQATPAKAKPVQVAAAAPVATPAAGARDSSNIALISGIGPTIEKKLHAAGITTWEQIAAWTDEDVAKWDKELALRGRATREEWVEQARELIAGKPPRARIDREAAESEK